MRNPRDGAGYINDELVTDTTNALKHYQPGRRVDRPVTGWSEYPREPELEPWDDAPVGVLVAHEQLCDSCRNREAS